MNTPLGSPLIPRETCLAGATEVDSPKSPAATKELQASDHESSPPLGSPSTVAKDFVPVSDKTRLELERKTARDVEAERLKFESQLPGIPGFRQIQNFIGGSSLLLITGLLAVVGLIVFSQTLDLLIRIPKLSIGLQVASYAIVAVLLTAIILPLARLAIRFLKLRSAHQIELGDLDRLDARQHLRNIAAGKRRLAVEQLMLHLREYPDPTLALARMDLEPALIDEIKKSAAALQDRSSGLGDTVWLADFKSTFHQHLETAAHQRINHHAKNAGVMTGLSRIPLADSLIILHSSFRMIEDLCAIYNLRLGKSATVVVMLLTGGHSILAGKIEESADLETFGKELFHNLSPFFVKAGLGAVESVAGAAAGMAGQGLLHYLLLCRLGNRTQKWLRMVR